MIDARKKPFEQALEEFSKESAPILKEYGKHRYFKPKRKTTSKHSGAKGRGKAKQIKSPGRRAAPSHHGERDK